ncbi:hypothetical protein A4S06_07455 [Erysipelotrichaceae bacterium MTC7]|nr:hypothetical protein A4S06_07455 [Erysipelotrichaceae bacterium MTC7]
MNQENQAMKLFQEGYNCAQSVFCAYSETYGVDEVTSFRLSQGFGGGIAHSGDVCGAACGMVMVASMHLCQALDVDKQKKEATYAKIEQMLQEFEACNGAKDCHDLLAMDDGQRIQGKKKVCVKAIVSCCDIIDKHLR